MLVSKLIIPLKVRIISSFLFICTFGCNSSQFDPHLISGYTMGTTYSVKLSDSLSEVEILKVKEAIDSTLFAVNQIFSTYIENSEISKINKNKISIISDEFKFVFKKSLEYFEMSNGTFDITVHPLVKLWGFGNEASIKSPPSKDKIINLLSKIGMNKVQLNNYNLVKDLEIELDMSAIAKGYGVDRIAEYYINIFPFLVLFLLL